MSYPNNHQADGGSRWNEVDAHLDENSAWWDDVSTKDVVETREDIIEKSFEQGVAELEQLLGQGSFPVNLGRDACCHIPQ